MLYLICILRIGIILLLIPASVHDLSDRKVPFVYLIAAGTISVSQVVVKCLSGGGRTTIITAALGILPGLAFCAIAWISKKIGMADGIIVSILGLSENYVCGIFVLCAGSILLSFISVVLLIMKKVDRGTKMPFVPFLEGGYVLWVIISATKGMSHV